MDRTTRGSWHSRAAASGLAALALLSAGMASGCRRSPNAPTAEMQKQWEQGPSPTPPPQAAEATRRAMQQGQPRR